MIKTFRLYTHLFLLKISSHFGVWLGTIIIVLKKKKTLDPTKLKNIYLNRSDRIGDAIISKPFIELFIEWLRKMGSEAQVTIIVSQYNINILKSLESPENGVFITEEKKNLDAYESKLSRMILKHIGFLKKTISFRLSHGNDRDETSLFLDMGGGDFSTILKYKELHNAVIAGPNIFWGSHILDIGLKHSYAHYANRNLIESYIEIIEKIFDITPSFREFIYDNIGRFYDYKEPSLKSGICLFVGVKEFRNLPVATWKRIIEETALVFRDEKIVVLDDHTNLLYEIFSKETFRENVQVVKNTFNLTEFTEYVSRFSFVAGIDGGGINMVKTLTNSCMIFTFAQHQVWSCFTGRENVQLYSGKNNWHTGVTRLSGDSEQLVSYMYKESIWLPTFNIDGNREMFSDFDTPLFLEIVKSALKK